VEYRRMSLRMPEPLYQSILDYANSHLDVTNLSQAIRRLIVQGLVAEGEKGGKEEKI